MAGEPLHGKALGTINYSFMNHLLCTLGDSIGLAVSYICAIFKGHSTEFFRSIEVEL